MLADPFIDHPSMHIEPPNGGDVERESSEAPIDPPLDPVVPVDISDQSITF